MTTPSSPPPATRRRLNTSVSTSQTRLLTHRERTVLSGSYHRALFSVKVPTGVPLQVVVTSTYLSSVSSGTPLAIHHNSAINSSAPIRELDTYSTLSDSGDSTEDWISRIPERASADTLPEDAVGSAILSSSLDDVDDSNPTIVDDGSDDEDIEVVELPDSGDVIVVENPEDLETCVCCMMDKEAPWCFVPCVGCKKLICRSCAATPDLRGICPLCRCVNPIWIQLKDERNSRFQRLNALADVDLTLDMDEDAPFLLEGIPSENEQAQVSISDEEAEEGTPLVSHPYNLRSAIRAFASRRTYGPPPSISALEEEIEE